MLLSIILDSYICENRHCSWWNYVRGEDWDYYSKTNGDCNICQSKCSKDPNCGGVECGGTSKYCSWWKKGKCAKSSEKTITFDRMVTGGWMVHTCIKISEGKYPSLEFSHIEK